METPLIEYSKDKTKRAEQDLILGRLEERKNTRERNKGRSGREG